MAMPALPGIPERPLWTVADLEQLPDDGNGHEVLHGLPLGDAIGTASDPRSDARRGRGIAGERGVAHHRVLDGGVGVSGDLPRVDHVVAIGRAALTGRE